MGEVKAKKEGILTEANVTGRKKQRMGEFTEVEDYIVKYVALRQERFKIDKCGLSWLHLKYKCDEMAPKLLGEARAAEFKASAGWLNNVLKDITYCIRDYMEKAMRCPKKKQV